MRRLSEPPSEIELSRAAALPRYHYAAGLWVITCYFNPLDYATRRCNYEVFAAALQQAGLPWLTVECVFPGQEFTLPAAPHVLRVRARAVLWQKERLLNLAIGALPATCRAVAWLDADVLFANARWAVETLAALEQRALVQLFSECVRLRPGCLTDGGEAERWPGFGYVATQRPETIRAGHFDAHGHTGFAWAARRELLGQHGLYDACIAGAGDHLIAHAACGDWESPCIERLMPESPAQQRHFINWAQPFAAATGGQVGYVNGQLLHLWHGEFQQRRYARRHQELARLGFNPFTDLRLGANGCWEWAQTRPELTAWFHHYFKSRQEDEECQEHQQKLSPVLPPSTRWMSRSAA